MSSAKSVPDDVKEEFWSVVRDCLREFHKMNRVMTRRKAAQLRTKIESMQSEITDLFYHSEPFDVACDIANHALNLEKYLDRYLQLRDEKQGDGRVKQVPRSPSRGVAHG
jgi:hypothetical protein